jgi:hypothetical protein
MCTLALTQTTEEKTPESLPSMVPLCPLPHAQRQLFSLGHNGCPKVDLLVRNPEKKRVIMPSPAQALASTKRKRVVLEEELVEVITELDSSPVDREPEMAPNVSIFNADRTNLEKVHVLLPLDGLIGVLDSLFACRECGQSGTHTIEKVSVGIARSLNFFVCTTIGCESGGSIKARVRSNGIRQDQDELKGLKYAPSSRIAVEAFDLNMRLVLQVAGICLIYTLSIEY